MRQNAFAARAPPWTRWESFSAPQDPLAQFGKGKEGKGIGGAWEGKGGGGREGKDKDW